MIRSRWPRGWVESYGVSMAVITLGPDGGVAPYCRRRRVRVPGFPTTVVDTVGAGDTFMAGFLDGYVNLGQPVPDSLRRGRGRGLDRLLPTGRSTADGGGGGLAAGGGKGALTRLGVA